MEDEKERIAKRDETLAELAELRKRDDLDADTRERIRKANRELQASYLAEVSPTAYASWKAGRAGYED